ncbi:hypothetical protein [Pseudomonas svalbardensis]|uniref:hypothetical protein n=1 Tax=Pseudomonas svalbardensis TaxID=3042029 RepID=UPI0024B3C10A|nr:hypothetical protein [Pseudomonas sp. PMCC200367]
MTAQNHPLLDQVLIAHGGLERWNHFSKVRATLVTGGSLWGMKGLTQDSAPRQMTVWLHHQRASVMPFGGPDQRTAFPENIATHCAVQDFYFGEDFLLRRHDYDVDVSGGLPAAQYVHDSVEADGQPDKDVLRVAIDLSDIRYA